MKRLNVLNDIHKNEQYKISLYKQAEIDENDIWSALELIGIKRDFKPKDIVNFLTPTILSFIVNSILGTKFLGVGLDLILRLLKIDFAQMLESLINAVKQIVNKDNFSQEEVNSAINSTVDSHLPSDKVSSSYMNESKNLRIIKLAYIHNYQQINKRADLIKLQQNAAGLAKTTNIFLKTIFKKIFNVLFFSTVMSGISTYIGRKSGLPGFDMHSPKYISKQKKFALNPNYKEVVLPSDYPWTEDINNNVTEIKNMLKSWAKEVYLGIKDEDLEKSEILDALSSVIKNYNILSTVHGIISIPEDFKSKKEVVDYFIDNVASYSKLPERIDVKPSAQPDSKLHVDVSRIKEIKSKALAILNKYKNNENLNPLEKRMINKKIEEATNKINSISDDKACDLENISYMQKAKKELSEIEDSFIPVSDKAREFAKELSPIIDEYLKICGK